MKTVLLSRKGKKRKGKMPTYSKNKNKQMKITHKLKSTHQKQTNNKKTTTKKQTKSNQLTINCWVRACDSEFQLYTCARDT